MISDFTKTALTIKRLKSVFTTESSGKEMPSDGVVMGLAEDGKPVFWPKVSAEQAGHVVVLGASGSGKSVLISRIIVEQIKKQEREAPEERPALVVEDAKGDLVDTVLAGLVTEAPSRLGDVVYLDPFQAGFAFNVVKLNRSGTPVEIRATQIAQTISALSTAKGSVKHLGTGPRQQDALENLVLACLTSAHPRSHVLLGLDALLDPQGFKKLASLTGSVRAKAFLTGSFLSEDLRASCAARLRSAFGATEAMERIVSGDGCIQYDEIIRPGAIVLYHVGNPPGGLVTAQEAWASLFTRLLIDHCMQRPSPWHGFPVNIFLDEAQVVAGVLAAEAERVLTLGRSKRLALTLMSQGTRLIKEADESLLPVLLGNAATRIVGRLAAPDAELLARELAPALGSGDNIRSFRSMAAGSICNLPDRSFLVLRPGRRCRFTSSTVDMQTWRRTVEEKAQEIQSIKSRFSLSAGSARLTLREATARAPQSSPRSSASSRPTRPPTHTLWG